MPEGELAIVLHTHMPYVEGFDVRASPDPGETGVELERKPFSERRTSNLGPPRLE